MSKNADIPIERLVQKGIVAVQADEYLIGFTLLSEAYGGVTEADFRDVKVAEGLSYYGLCLALVQRKYKPAVDFARKAIELQFYNARHYLNLGRIYLAAGKRKKALEAVEEGLKTVPDDVSLARLRDEIGKRSAPPIPFLPRANPINVAIGRSRHARKVKEKEKKEP